VGQATFEPGKNNHPDIKELKEAGYNFIIQDNKDFNKLVNEQFLSQTKIISFFYAKLKDFGASFPSYDKFRKIIYDFVVLGLLVSKGNKTKKYTINPLFYQRFHNDFYKILE